MNIDFVRHSGGIAVFDGAYTPETRSEPPVSIAGVILLSALAVVLTIIGVLLLGATLVAAWWIVVHIPVPPVVWRGLALIGL